VRKCEFFGKRTKGADISRLIFMEGRGAESNILKNIPLPLKARDIFFRMDMFQIVEAPFAIRWLKMFFSIQASFIFPLDRSQKISAPIFLK
jgi:hypothetical protein